MDGSPLIWTFDSWLLKQVVNGEGHREWSCCGSKVLNVHEDGCIDEHSIGIRSTLQYQKSNCFRDNYFSLDHQQLSWTPQLAAKVTRTTRVASHGARPVSASAVFNQSTISARPSTSHPTNQFSSVTSQWGVHVEQNGSSHVLNGNSSSSRPLVQRVRQVVHENQQHNQNNESMTDNHKLQMEPSTQFPDASFEAYQKVKKRASSASQYRRSSIDQIQLQQSLVLEKNDAFLKSSVSNLIRGTHAVGKVRTVEITPSSSSNVGIAPKHSRETSLYKNNPLSSPAGFSLYTNSVLAGTAGTQSRFAFL
jgi:hypothetical protein